MARGSNGWDIGKLPMLMIRHSGRRVNRNLCHMPSNDKKIASCALHFVNMYKNAQFIYRSFEIFVHLCYDIEKETEEPFALSFLPHQRKEPTL